MNVQEVFIGGSYVSPEYRLPGLPQTFQRPNDAPVFVRGEAIRFKVGPFDNPATVTLTVTSPENKDAPIISQDIVLEAKESGEILLSEQVSYSLSLYSYVFDIFAVFDLTDRPVRRRLVSGTFTVEDSPGSLPP